MVEESKVILSWICLLRCESMDDQEEVGYMVLKIKDGD